MYHFQMEIPLVENLESSPIIRKRKKFFTGREIIGKLKEHNNKISEVCKEITEELCPHNLSEMEEGEAQDILEKIERVAEILRVNVGRLAKANKERKYRHCPEKLDERFISCSQYSCLQSEASGGDLESQDLDSSYSPNLKDHEEYQSENSDARRINYQKKPLDSDMTEKTRRRRVKEKRDIVKEWALEEGVTPSQLLGLMVYLDNYQGSKSLADIGWKIFCKEKLTSKHEASIEGSLWLIE